VFVATPCRYVDTLCARRGELGLLKVPVFYVSKGARRRGEQRFARSRWLTGVALVQIRSLVRRTASGSFAERPRPTPPAGREALEAAVGARASVARQLLGQMSDPPFLKGLLFLSSSGAYIVADIATLLAGTFAVIVL